MGLLKLKDVAGRLDCSVSNVYALVREGKLPVLKVGLKKGLRVDEADLLAYLAKVRCEGAGAALLPALRHIRLPGGSP
jgi:excisionase family DNA binding protein